MLPMYNGNRPLQGKNDKIAWLETVSFTLSTELVNSWSNHHAAQRRSMVSAVCLNSILSLIDKPVHSLETQVHCMQVIKNTVDFLNPEQTAIDVCDQPVFVLTKEKQWRKPEQFDPSYYFFYLENCTWNIAWS